MSAIQALGAAALSVFTSNWMVTIFCWKRPNRRPTPSLTHYRGTRRRTHLALSKGWLVTGLLASPVPGACSLCPACPRADPCRRRGSGLGMLHCRMAESECNALCSGSLLVVRSGRSQRRRRRALRNAARYTRLATYRMLARLVRTSSISGPASADSNRA